jgi:hypothetical protein
MNTSFASSVTMNAAVVFSLSSGKRLPAVYVQLIAGPENAASKGTPLELCHYSSSNITQLMQELTSTVCAI